MRCAVFPENTVEEGDDFLHGAFTQGMVVRALDLLRGNGIVSVTVGAWEGRHMAVGPLLGGEFQIALGAPGLAFASGASLLPVFTLRGPERAYSYRHRTPNRRIGKEVAGEFSADRERTVAPAA